MTGTTRHPSATLCSDCTHSWKASPQAQSRLRQRPEIRRPEIQTELPTSAGVSVIGILDFEFVWDLVLGFRILSLTPGAVSQGEADGA
jgi:hypothetical protein